MQTTEFILFLVLGSFILGRFIFLKTKLAFLHPVIISIAIIIIFLKTTGISYEVFIEKSNFINFLLGPTVVALGYLLHQQYKLLKKNMTSILFAVFIGAIVGITSVIFIAHFSGADELLVYSISSKSVTTPIALSLSAQYGGNISLTAIIVVVCGIYGSVVGPYVLKIFNIKSRIATGLALGSAAHGIGTARAMEIGITEGAIGGLAIGLMGVMTAILIPLFHLLYVNLLL